MVGQVLLIDLENIQKFDLSVLPDWALCNGSSRKLMCANWMGRSLTPFDASLKVHAEKLRPDQRRILARMRLTAMGRL
jgi:hypothetical protein